MTADLADRLLDELRPGLVPAVLVQLWPGRRGLGGRRAHRLLWRGGARV